MKLEETLQRLLDNYETDLTREEIEEMITRLHNPDTIGTKTAKSVPTGYLNPRLAVARGA